MKIYDMSSLFGTQLIPKAIPTAWANDDFLPAGYTETTKRDFTLATLNSTYIPDHPLVKATTLDLEGTARMPDGTDDGVLSAWVSALNLVRGYANSPRIILPYGQPWYNPPSRPGYFSNLLDDSPDNVSIQTAWTQRWASVASLSQCIWIDGYLYSDPSLLTDNIAYLNKQMERSHLMGAWPRIVWMSPGYVAPTGASTVDFASIDRMLNAVIDSGADGIIYWAGDGGTYPLTQRLQVLADSTMSYSSTVLLKSPKVYLRLNETAGAVATDLSGNGFNGAYHNAPTLHLTGPFKGSSGVSFNGVNQAISIPDFDCTSQIAVEFWIKPNAANLSGDILAKFSSNADLQCTFTISASQLSMRINANAAGQQVNGSTVLLPDVWYHVVGTYDNTSLRLYINSVEDAAPVICTGPLTANDFTWDIAGAYSFGTQFVDITLSEFIIYDHGLSAADVQENYAAALAMNGPTIIRAPNWRRNRRPYRKISGYNFRT